ncbi:hypothetical protein [Streptosporangium sp. NPDC000396]|uniref:hypothetical protein n=1 Tax=Streptosporangium sp. NPDC000396 TaxID=3366185 RepID=UPI0036AB0AFF
MDPVILLGVPFVTSAFDFLFRRAETLIDRRASKGADKDENVADTSILEGTLQPLKVDERALERYGDELMRLYGGLSTYSRERSRITTEDEALRERLGELRVILEHIYGQRITFKGENRPLSGSRVDQDVETAEGPMVGIDAKRIHGSADVVQRVGRVTETGSVTGIKAEDLW